MSVTFLVPGLLVLLVLPACHASGKVASAKTLYPSDKAPLKNAYGLAIDGGSTWIAETPGSSGSKVYILDSKNMFLSPCERKTWSYINHFKLKFKTELSCPGGYGGVTESSSSKDGSVAQAMCRMTRKMGNGKSGAVDAWWSGKHRSC